MGEDLSGFSLDAGAIAYAVAHHGLHVSRVDAGHGAASEQGAAEIEVPVPDQRRVLLAGGADGIRRQRVTAAVPSRIGRAVADAEDRSAKLVLMLKMARKVQEGRQRRCHRSGLATDCWWNAA